MSKSNKNKGVPEQPISPIARCAGAYVYPPETSGIARCSGQVPGPFPRPSVKVEPEPIVMPSETSTEQSEEESSPYSVESIRRLLSEKLGFICEDKRKSSTEKVLKCLTLEGLANYWKAGCIKKVITMVGAGISTSAGIPDFRSPHTGLYNNLSKYKLPRPMSIFELDYFKKNPKPFYTLARELYPGFFKPTPCHYFIRMLHEKGLLVRHYSQNIDTLERIANIPESKIVEAHGTFYTNHCIDCKKSFSMEWMKEQIFDDVIPTCDNCNSIVKPDIVFFGENLPDKFYDYPDKDFKNCDLLIIMGTSLEVQPFASLVDKADNNCLRLLINREKVGQRSDALSSWLLFGPGLKYDCPDNKRDIACIGDCDEGVLQLADLLGWGDELREMVRFEHSMLDEVSASSNDDFSTTFEEEANVDNLFDTGKEEEAEEEYK